MGVCHHLLNPSQPVPTLVLTVAYVLAGHRLISRRQLPTLQGITS